MSDNTTALKIIAAKDARLVELFEENQNLRSRLVQAEAKVEDQKKLIEDWRKLYERATKAQLTSLEDELDSAGRYIEFDFPEAPK